MAETEKAFATPQVQNEANETSQLAVPVMEAVVAGGDTVNGVRNSNPLGAFSVL